MNKIITSLVASLLLALSFVSFSAAETSKTYYEKENGVWTGTSNQYVYTDDVLTTRVKRMYDANGKIKSKVEYTYENGLYNGVSTEVVYDANGKMTKKVKRSYSSKGILANQVEYSYKDGKWSGVSKETSYQIDGTSSTRKSVIKKTYNSAGKLQYKSGFYYSSGELRYSDHYDYDTKNGLVTKEVYKEYNAAGIKIVEEQRNRTNGKWDGVYHLSEYDEVTGEKLTRSSQTLNGKGELVHEVTYTNVNKSVGWKKTSEAKYKNEKLVFFELKVYDQTTGKLTSVAKQSPVKNGKYSITIKQYATNGKMLAKVEMFIKDVKGEDVIYEMRAYEYEDGKWNGLTSILKFDDKGNITSSEVV